MTWRRTVTAEAAGTVRREASRDRLRIVADISEYSALPPISRGNRYRLFAVFSFRNRALVSFASASCLRFAILGCFHFVPSLLGLRAVRELGDNASLAQSVKNLIIEFSERIPVSRSAHPKITA